MASINIFGQLPDIHTFPWSSQEEALHSFTNFCKMIEASHREKDVNIYYDSLNAQHFLDEIDLISDTETYFENPKNRLRLLFRSANNWRDQSKQSGAYHYFIWDIGSFSCTQLLHDTLCETVEFLINYQSKILIVFAKSPSGARDFFAVFKDAPHSPNLPTFYQIPFIFEIEILENWLASNRKKRVFNLNPKHGENGIGNHQEGSPLRCNRQRAGELLNTAIGNKAITRELYNYDLEHQRYIVFKLDGSSNDADSYHGYHIDNENEIDVSIRTLLEEKLSNIR